MKAGMAQKVYNRPRQVGERGTLECGKLSAVQPSSDQEIMSAIGHGHREFDWDVWFGDVDGAAYLTEVGREAARRAIKDVAPSRAHGPAPGGLTGG
jgi:hypothetical protein